MVSSNKFLRLLTGFSAALALMVILLGAYTRLTGAGLGCPDWPGCYGQLTAPHTNEAIQNANIAYPEAPVDIPKARTEMTHRYFAETLGLLILVIGFLAYRQRALPIGLPLGLILLVIVQGLFGMWTVTLKLFPPVVMGHLLGGFATLSILWLMWLGLQPATPNPIDYPKPLKRFSLVVLMIVILQITLGGWTSANYAALSCLELPYCALSSWGAWQWGPEAIDYPARVTIHMMHRIGALITVLSVCILSTQLWKNCLYKFSILLLSLTFLQIGLGLLNVLLVLPLPIAVAHNGVAVLLLLSVISLNFKLQKTPTHG